jgi:hypothetical protein
MLIFDRLYGTIHYIHNTECSDMYIKKIYRLLHGTMSYFKIVNGTLYFNNWNSLSLTNYSELRRFSIKNPIYLFHIRLIKAKIKLHKY